MYHAKDYKYIGGYYGACNEASMMHDLYHFGPIVVALNAPSDLFYYNGGIYDSKDEDRSDWDITKTSRWEKTNHAVTCIGWGEENGEKYWIIKKQVRMDFGITIRLRQVLHCEDVLLLRSPHHLRNPLCFQFSWFWSLYFCFKSM